MTKSMGGIPRALEIDVHTDVQEGSPGYENYTDWLANTQLEQQVIRP